jgi:hypothetical protein
MDTAGATYFKYVCIACFTTWQSCWGQVHLKLLQRSLSCCTPCDYEAGPTWGWKCSPVKTSVCILLLQSFYLTYLCIMTLSDGNELGHVLLLPSGWCMLTG